MTNQPDYRVQTLFCIDCEMVAMAITTTDLSPSKMVKGGHAWEGHSVAADDQVEELTGPDWRPLLAKAATDMATRTGLLINHGCLSAFVNDKDEVLAIHSEGLKILEALRNAQLAAVPPMTEEESQEIVERYEELCGLEDEPGLSDAEQSQRELATRAFTQIPAHALALEDTLQQRP